MLLRLLTTTTHRVSMWHLPRLCLTSRTSTALLQWFTQLFPTQRTCFRPPQHILQAATRCNGTDMPYMRKGCNQVHPGLLTQLLSVHALLLAEQLSSFCHWTLRQECTAHIVLQCCTTLDKQHSISQDASNPCIMCGRHWPICAMPCRLHRHRTNVNIKQVVF